MDEINKKDELKHWGILGMKWGIRRTPEQLGKQSAKKKAEQEKDKFLTSKKKSVSKLTDDELTKEINRRKKENELEEEKNRSLKAENTRLELEQAYAKLNPPKVSLGRKIFDSVWPTIEKNTLEAGGTLLKEGLVSKGKELLGLKDSKQDYDYLTKKLTYDEKVKGKSDAEKKLDNLKIEKETLAVQQQIDALKKKQNGNP